MNRWRSPQAASKRAERIRIEAEKTLPEKRRGRKQLAAMLLLIAAVFVGDLAWRYSKLTNRAERRRQHAAETNRSKASQAATNMDEKAQAR